MRDSKQIEQMRIVYQLPRMEEVTVRKDIVYKTVDGEDLMLDVYYPLDAHLHVSPPAVIFVHGGSQPEHVERVRESQPYTSWCRLLLKRMAPKVVCSMECLMTRYGSAARISTGLLVDGTSGRRFRLISPQRCSNGLIIFSKERAPRRTRRSR